MFLTPTDAPGFRCCFNRRDAARFGTVGRAFDGMRIELAEDGELLLGGPCIFSGYYGDPEATDRVLQDGLVRSGDLGVDAGDGYFRIVGRKKELIITAGGKNVSPVPIEHRLNRCPLVAESVVVGDRRP